MTNTFGIRSINDDDFIALVKNSNSYASICRSLKLRVQGSNYNVIKHRIAKLNLKTDHFLPVGSWLPKAQTIPLESILIENSTYDNSNELKRRLLKAGMIENRCFKCGNAGLWQNEPLTLQIDHINGNRSDNRIENLRLACPNCHSQTPTHSGKRFKKHYFCKDCGIEISKLGTRCVSCSGKLQPKKLTVSKEELKKLVWQKTLLDIAKENGVGMTCIRSRCAEFGIDIPPRGYWLRRRNGYSHEQSLFSVKPLRQKAKRFTQEQIINIKELHKSKQSIRSIAEKYKVAHTTISRLLNGSTKYICNL